MHISPLSFVPYGLKYAGIQIEGGGGGGSATVEPPPLPTIGKNLQMLLYALYSTVPQFVIYKVSFWEFVQCLGLPNTTLLFLHVGHYLLFLVGIESDLCILCIIVLHFGLAFQLILL